MNNNFKTFDINLTATLVSLGFEIVIMDRSNQRKVEFHFDNQKRLHDMVQLYWEKKLNLEPQMLFSNLKQLKNRIYST